MGDSQAALIRLPSPGRTLETLASRPSASMTYVTIPECPARELIGSQNKPCNFRFETSEYFRRAVPTSRASGDGFASRACTRQATRNSSPRSAARTSGENSASPARSWRVLVVTRRPAFASRCSPTARHSWIARNNRDCNKTPADRAPDARKSAASDHTISAARS